MKKLIALRAGVAAVLTVWAAPSMAAVVTGTATVVAPLVVSTTTNLNFGSIVPGATAGTVILSTASTRSATGGTLLGNGTTPIAGVIHLTGSGTSTFQATFTGGVLSNGTQTMAVSAYVMKVTGGVDQTSVYTGALVAGVQDFTVGATLAVGTSAANPAGTYTTALAGGSSLTVTVIYN